MITLAWAIYAVGVLATLWALVYELVQIRIVLERIWRSL